MKLQRAEIKDEIDNLKDMVMIHASCNHPSFLAGPSKNAEVITDVPTQEDKTEITIRWRVTLNLG